MIAAMFYYYDHYMCSGINNNYDYLLKQCAVWWILNTAHGWYKDGVHIETGNGVHCNSGHWVSAHKEEYYMNGIAWAEKNYQYFTDAYGVIYEGEGQPISKWGGNYTPTGTAKLKKESANPELTNGNPCYSLAGAEFGVYSSASLSGASRVGTFTTDANGDSNTLTLNAGDYYVAGRSLGPLVLAGTVCATIIGGSAMMGRAGLGYDYGSLAVVTALPYLIGMFVFSGISGRIQEVGVKYNITSIPELFEKRFSKTAKCLIALLIGYTMMGTVASQITAVAVIVKMIGGKIGITYEMGACLATFIFIFYTAASGLFGVVYTDVVQFFMLIIFVYILLPLSGIRYLGGFGNF